MKIFPSNASLKNLKRWISLLILMPSLYLFGWLIAQTMFFLGVIFQKDQLPLIGTIFTFLLFLMSLPIWIRLRWREVRPWQALGITRLDIRKGWTCFLRGICLSFSLIVVVLIFAFLGSWGSWQIDLTIQSFLNALLLGIGIGFAEELIFRGWLWGELSLLIGYRWSIISQAAIFSLAHIQSTNMSLWEFSGLIMGLFLLGLLLAIRRILDNGCLWGSIGMHGGFVGGWFLCTSDLVEFSSNLPNWFFGPGGLAPNPIGGFFAIFIFSLLIWHYRTAFAIAGPPINGACKASSIGATP